VKYQPEISDSISLDAIQTKFAADDSSVNEIVLNAGRHLGRALGGVVGTLDIKTILLTGDVTRFGAPWLAAVGGAMKASALMRMTEETELKIGKLDYRACILGSSAYLLLDDYSLLFLQKEN
jgi:predicted NBD/HSP70 family sugar kinase